MRKQTGYKETQPEANCNSEKPKAGLPLLPLSMMKLKLQLCLRITIQ